MTSIVRAVKQNFFDLFKYEVRTTHIDDNGNEHSTRETPSCPPNPIRLLRTLTWVEWGQFLIGYAAWTADAFDFHGLTIQTTKLATYYHVSKTHVTEAITLTLLLRTVGAAIFGIVSDLFGRKYPLAINMWLLGLTQIATIYAKTFAQFLAVRSLFGLCMGGVFGCAASMALENVPSEARGFFSGIFQQGYSLGYVLAACVNLGVGGAANSWPTVFWVGAGMSFVVGALRLFYPESKIFLKARQEKGRGSGMTNFRRNFGTMVKTEWKACLYAITFMSLFNCFAHTSQDSYTTFMLVQKNLGASASSRASIWMKAGSCVGGGFWGYFSQWIGRRRIVVVAYIICLCLIPAWILPNTEAGLEAGGFFMQLIASASGVIPIYLSELSPPAFRAMFVGLTYQIGAAISSPTTQVINDLAEHHHVRNSVGKRVEAYGPVMAIATAVVGFCLIVFTAFGPEKKGVNFETVGTAMEDPLASLHKRQNAASEMDGRSGVESEKLPMQRRQGIRSDDDPRSNDIDRS